MDRLARADPGAIRGRQRRLFRFIISGQRGASKPHLAARRFAWVASGNLIIAIRACFRYYRYII